jgi:hypothetical protein
MEGTMTTVVIIAVLAIALVTYVWVRQERHQLGSGEKPQSPDAIVEKQGRHWGTSSGTF